MGQSCHIAASHQMSHRLVTYRLRLSAVLRAFELPSVSLSGLFKGHFQRLYSCAYNTHAVGPWRPRTEPVICDTSHGTAWSHGDEHGLQL